MTPYGTNKVSVGAGISFGLDQSENEGGKKRVVSACNQYSWLEDMILERAISDEDGNGGS